MLENTRTHYRVDVVNLPRLPLPEVASQLSDLLQLVKQGWSARLFDDVPKCTFVFVAHSLSGLSAKVSIPYEYLENLVNETDKARLMELWKTQNDLHHEMMKLLMVGLNEKSDKVKEL